MIQEVDAEGCITEGYEEWVGEDRVSDSWVVASDLLRRLGVGKGFGEIGIFVFFPLLYFAKVDGGGGGGGVDDGGERIKVALDDVDQCVRRRQG